GPFDQAIAWSTQGVKGVFRFLERFWNLSFECAQKKESSPEAQRAVHKLNKKIDDDLKKVKFNTPIAAFMEFVNFAQRNKKEIGRNVIKQTLLLMAPFAPHLSEELWNQLDFGGSVHQQKWPKYDQKLVKEKIITLVIQVNGKVRDKIEVEADILEKEAQELALAREKIKKWIKGKKTKKVVFVPQKLINIVV
ncbi:leucine--tRNA ligase, partial [Parcubacteria bacterium DG_74_3]